MRNYTGKFENIRYFNYDFFDHIVLIICHEKRSVKKYSTIFINFVQLKMFQKLRKSFNFHHTEKFPQIASCKSDQLREKFNRILKFPRNSNEGSFPLLSVFI